MLLFKVFLVAFALAKRGGGHHGGRGGRGRIPRECKDVEEETYENFLTNTDGTGLLDTLATGTMYCTIDAKYAEWPGCPAVDPTEAPIDGQRRNLGGKGKKDNNGGKKDKVKYNRGRFTMGAGTSSVVQVEYNAEEGSTYECVSGDALKFTVTGSQLVQDPVEALSGRRLLKMGGDCKVTATLQMEQVGSCDIAHELSCKSYLQAVADQCTAAALSCETPKDSESDTRVKMTCYLDENDVKGWEDQEVCSTGEDATDDIINLSIEP